MNMFVGVPIPCNERGNYAYQSSNHMFCRENGGLPHLILNGILIRKTLVIPVLCVIVNLLTALTRET